MVPRERERDKPKASGEADNASGWPTYDATFIPRGGEPLGWTFFAPDDEAATVRAEQLAADAAPGIAAERGAFAATLLLTRRA